MATFKNGHNGKGFWPLETSFAWLPLCSRTHDYSINYFVFLLVWKWVQPYWPGMKNTKKKYPNLDHIKMLTFFVCKIRMIKVTVQKVNF